MKQAETEGRFVLEPARHTPVVAEAEVIVVGGGSAGVAAAAAAARNGADSLLIERYGYLGGDATGSMVLVLDDMTDGQQITVGGIAQELIDRMNAENAVMYPPPADCYQPSEAAWARWRTWGFEDLYSRSKPPKPIVYTVSFDSEAFKVASLDLLRESGARLRLHSAAVGAVVEDGTVVGVITESKSGRQAIRGQIVIDASGDGDIFSSAGAAFNHGRYLLTVVHRIGNVDVEQVERFEREDPTSAHDINAQIKRIYGGSWDQWWLRTVREGVVWANCPHFNGLDGLSVEDLTQVEVEGRQRIREVIAFARQHMPGFARAYLLDTGAQVGVRQTRLLEGEYVLTKEDILERRRFDDCIGRGRDYYMPYRSLLPRSVENLLVAGRHYSATPAAQRMSREIPPCQVMGQAAGTAAALAVRSRATPRTLPIRQIQETLVAQGAILETKADPGGTFAVARSAGL